MFLPCFVLCVNLAAKVKTVPKIELQSSTDTTPVHERDMTPHVHPRTSLNVQARVGEYFLLLSNHKGKYIHEQSN